MSTRKEPSGRLTNDLRQSIKEKMRAYAMGIRIEDSLALVCQLAYERLMTDQRRALPEFLIKDNWVHLTNRATLVWFEDRSSKSSYAYNGVQLPQLVPFRQPTASVYDMSDLRIELYENEAETDSLVAAWKAHNVILAEGKAISGKLDAVLASVNTTNRLLEILPEAIDFLPDPGKSSSLVPIETINSLRRVFST